VSKSSAPDRRPVVTTTIPALFAACLGELSPKGRLIVALRHACGLAPARVARLLLTTESDLAAELLRTPETPNGPKISTVMRVVYLLYTDAFPRSGPTAFEALRLGRALFGLFPSASTVAGLLALLTLSEARAPARFDADGRTIPLDRQDRTAFDGDAVERGAALLLHAMRLGPLDVYGLQAAIALEHASPGPKRWDRIEALYGDLEALAPSPVVTLNRAVATRHVHGPAVALARIESLAEELDGYVAFAVLSAVLLRDLGRLEEARRAFDRAIAWSHDDSEIAHLRYERDKL
jgi:RNA polymerase sigma-70 factor, ECF subfamily